MLDPSVIEIVKKIVVSVILATVLGLERQRHGRIAGLRTHILVCLASCILMVISTNLNTHADTFSFYRFDPLRLAAGIMTGMGFIGAGTIIRTGTINVRGVTTAAGLWLTSAIGISVGLGNYFVAMITAGVCFLVLVMNIDRLIPSESFIILCVNTSTLESMLGKIKETCIKHGADFIDADISKDKTKNLIQYRIQLKFGYKIISEDILDELIAMENIESVKYEYV